MNLYHYTVAYRAAMILRDGLIRRACGTPWTLPYVWLSSNAAREPTAMGASKSLQHIFGNWLGARARFLVAAPDAVAFRDLPIKLTTRRKLTKRGLELGGIPKQWFAVDRDIPSGDLALEIEEDGSWRGIVHAALLERYAGFEFEMHGPHVAVIPPKRGASVSAFS
jgi:hypothetical protein